MRVPESIFIDRPLREFLGKVNALIQEDPSRIGSGESGIEGQQIRGGWEEPGVLRFHRQFAGFRWTFVITSEQVDQAAAGNLGELLMERIGPAPIGKEATNALADGLLSSMGLDEAGDDEVLARTGSLAGLTDESSADISETPSDEEIDALLSNPEVAKLLDALGIDVEGEDNKSEDTPETKPAPPPRAEEPAPADAPPSGLLGLLDELAPDDSMGSVNRDQVAEAKQFLELLLNGEKIELVDAPDLDGLAEGLAMVLADDQEKASVRAGTVIDWFLDQDAVEDIYLSDEEMTRILKAW